MIVFPDFSFVGDGNSCVNLNAPEFGGAISLDGRLGKHARTPKRIRACNIETNCIVDAALVGGGNGDTDLPAPATGWSRRIAKRHIWRFWGILRGIT